ncbi:phosphonate C-P lyase system protein PhnH [Parasutterella excrementihominis]
MAFRADYPRGVDLLLCADTQLVVLPRHLTLEII